MKFSTIQRALFIGLLGIVTVLFIWMIRGYLFPVFWAAVLAILFYPVKRRWLAMTRKLEIVSVVLTILTILLIVVLPLFFLGKAVVRESLHLYQNVNGGNNSIESVIERVNTAVPLESWLSQIGISEEELRTTIRSRAQDITQYIVNRAASFGQDTVRFIISFAVMLYLLYHFLRHGEKLVQRLQHMLPFGDRREQRLFEKFASTTRATIKGTFIIGILQGLLGGVLFWIVGIQSPVLWGALMAVLAIIPAVGTFLVWAPAGIILILGGGILPGIVVLVIGALVLSTIDNILRPPLIGHDTKMPDALILVATLGGLSAFGVSGFIIGPIIAAFFLAVWKMFEEEYSGELKKSG